MKKKYGYILDTQYPIFFYKEMTPLWLSSCVNFLGFKTVDITKKFSYLELACATGINLIVNAINNPNGYFVGVDFNSKHIEVAQKRAKELNLKNIEFICCDFDTFFKQNSKKFDFIVNHGTFSWVSKEVQKDILNIVSSFLDELGIFYIHYMCYPASASLLSIQKLFNIVDNNLSNSSIKSVEIAKELFFDLNEACAFVDNAKIDSIIRTLNENSNSYLAHEFLTDYWQPLFSVDLHKMVFENTQTTFLGSANIVDNIENISIPAKLQDIVKAIKVPALKEYVKDLARNSKQRVDIFQKNPQVLQSDEYSNAINQIGFKLISNLPKNAPFCFKTTIGDIKAPDELVDVLEKNFAKKDLTFKEMLSLDMFKNNHIFLIETIFLLVSNNYLHFVSKNAKLVDKTCIKKFSQITKEDDIKLKLLSECATAI